LSDFNEIYCYSVFLVKRYFHIEGKLHSHKRQGPHNINIIEIIIGTLLGDGHLEKRPGGIGCRLKFEQTNRNVEYLM
jgi:ubiquinol-cytochrome c reductase cytochrome b subunit